MYKSVALLICALCAIDAAVVPVRIGHYRPNKDGVFYKDDRIIGGTIPKEGDYPYQIALFRTYLPGAPAQFQCGGTLISPDFILTAAHCVSDVLIASNIHCRAGEHYLDGISGNEEEHNAQRITVHPEYDANTQANDIAIIKTNAPFTLNTVISTLALPSPTDKPENTTCTVSGWGSTFSGGSIARNLHAVDVPTVDDITCQSNYANNPIAASMLCAGTAGRDSCQGDSGGPLTCDGERKVIHGIVSWGNGCALEGYPGVYTEVSYHRDFIFGVTGL